MRTHASQSEKRENNLHPVSRREFLKTAMLATAMLVGPKRWLGAPFYGGENSRLDALDSYIGDEGLEGVLQEEYNKGFRSKLRIRAGPGVAQLPYKGILEMLTISKDNPLIMLYPAASDEVSTILFGHLMRKHAMEEFPLNIICTEIDPAMPRSFDKQIRFLADKKVLEYEKSERSSRNAREFNFRIYPRDTSCFDITYKLGSNPDEFYSEEDAVRANLFRELASPAVPVHYWFLAQMLKQGYKKDKSIMLITQDYDNIAPKYSDLLQRAEGYVGEGQPLRVINDKQIVLLEEKNGPLRIEYSGKPGEYRFRVGTDLESRERPMRDIPGEITFYRGYAGCSCDRAMQHWKETGKEIEKTDYSVLFRIQPGDLEDISETELTERIRKAFRGCYVNVD